MTGGGWRREWERGCLLARQKGTDRTGADGRFPAGRGWRQPLQVPPGGERRAEPSGAGGERRRLLPPAGPGCRQVAAAARAGPGAAAAAAPGWGTGTAGQSREPPGSAPVRGCPPLPAPAGFASCRPGRWGSRPPLERVAARLDRCDAHA